MSRRISLPITLLSKLPDPGINDDNSHTGNGITVGGFKDAVFYLVPSDWDGNDIEVKVKIQNYDETSKIWVDFFSFADIINTAHEPQRVEKTVIGRKIRICYKRTSGTGTINISCGADLKE